jgi:ribosomal protein RSM22 (predicted rRNA methylase)
MTTPQAALSVVQENVLANTSAIQTLLNNNNVTSNALTKMETDLYDLLTATNVLEFDPEQENLKPIKQNIRKCIIILIDLITIKNSMIYEFFNYYLPHLYI